MGDEDGGAGEASYLRTLGIDEALSRTDATGTLAYLTDALGSTLALADSSGAASTTYTYAPFGETSVSGLPSSSPFQFTGRENDGTGLYYYRARYYDPMRGRFVQEDPIGFLAGDTHLYRYMRGNPFLGTDPEGLFLAPYHGLISFAAMITSGYDPITSAYVAGTSIGADFAPGSTSVDAANAHGMARPDQTRQEAEAGTGRFISEKLAEGSLLTDA
jgi:RHS repeat-associated protein